MSLILPTNLALMRIAQRAERQPDEVLVKTFVDFGTLYLAVSAVDHQIVYGRRGTGKTHLLTYLRKKKNDEGELSVQVDMRNIGSSGGIYADQNIPLPERATRLLIDVLASIHGAIMQDTLSDKPVADLSLCAEGLDLLLAAQREIKVVGTTSIENTQGAEATLSSSEALDISAAATGVAFTYKAKEEVSGKESGTYKRSDSGVQVPKVSFGRAAEAFRKIVANLPKKKLWIVLDEWSEIPLDLQPFLADLVRRAILPVTGITVKIAAIEQRTNLRIIDKNISYIGIQLGADVSPAIVLDDYMVFDNNEDTAVEFFKELFFKHVHTIMLENGETPPASASKLISAGFTQVNAFAEAVRACEGVPRDAIYILGQAAQKANADTISVERVRVAAEQWFQISKESTVSANAQAKKLLQWIVDKVIKERRTKAFLLESGTNDALIDFLYDERILHVLKRGISAQDQPGKRYVVYGIDYGCYVQLINTATGPRGILDTGADEADYTGVVPKTDFRSIRRCILDLEEFYQAWPAPK